MTEFLYIQDKTPLAYRATQGGLWVTVSSGWQLLFGFIANIFLTRLLMPSAFGEFALAMFFCSTCDNSSKNRVRSGFCTVQKYFCTFFIIEGLAVVAGIFFMAILTYLLPHFGYSISIINICTISFHFHGY
jgi:hypothetical protein